MLQSVSNGSSLAPLYHQLVDRKSIVTGKIVELLASHDTLMKRLSADYVAYFQQHNRGFNAANTDDLALLVTNLLSRDCRDANPSVACSAVMALAALSVSPDTALNDIFHTLDSSHQKIRRSSVLACLRYHSTHPQTAISSGLTDALYDRLRDSDPIVVANSLIALDQILSDEGGVVVNRPIALYLLSNLPSFSDSSLETVLSFLMRYTPKNDVEVFEKLLNPIDPYLRSDNPVILVAAVELFLRWTASHPNLKSEVLRLVQPSLCRIFLSASSEMCYLLLEFILSLGEIGREVFSPYYRTFNLNTVDPSYLKVKKMDLLGSLATEETVNGIISEIQPYCSDFDSYKSAIACLATLGQICLPAQQKVFSLLAELLQATSDKIVEAALQCVLLLVSGRGPRAPKNKSRNNVLCELSQETSSSSLPPSQTLLPPCLISSISDVISRPSLPFPTLVLHTISELREELPCSLALLEHLSVNPLCPEDRCLLLTVIARVFLRRPAEARLLLIKTIEAGAESSDPDVVRHSAMVRAMLSHGPEAASKLLGVPLLSDS